ncbi:hypothetical protein C8R43DRAFT_1121302 [Mycena crocata]|nr:hypothetical protein C8R43DRAFT_947981 [Mycena crocata]KAJ7168095.1 hypothetical protein C8R43DRAFT_1121302 [Mycena crocata]
MTHFTSSQYTDYSGSQSTDYIESQPTATAPTQPAPAPAPATSTECVINMARPTCPMPYHPDAGVDRIKHSLTAGCKFYVVCPGLNEGTYTNSDRASDNVIGIHKGYQLSVHTWEEALAEWKMRCRKHHGFDSCPRVNLGRRPPVTMNTRVWLPPAPEPVRGEFWGVKGLLEVYETRDGAFTAAAASKMKDIHIRATNDMAALEAFIHGRT